VGVATLTFKGPVTPGAFKSREEFETPVGDAETAVRILDELGFVVILAYQKRRERWRLHDCQIELDEPPHIGLFVEIEGPDEAAIRSVRTELGLDAAPLERASYVRMLLSHYGVNGGAERAGMTSDGPVTDA
jgi:adenylate cyclase class 2